MSLSAFFAPLLPESGTDGTKVRPVNEGELVTVVDQNPVGEAESFWDRLDWAGMGESVLSGVSDLAAAAVEGEVKKLKFGPEQRADTTGDPADQAGLGVQASKVQEPSFIEKNKTAVMIGVGVLGLAVLVMAVKK